MTNTTDELRDKLIDRALNLLDLAKPEDELEVFKVVSTFYLGATKAGVKPTDGSKAGGTFADIQRRLAGGIAPANGGTA